MKLEAANRLTYPRVRLLAKSATLRFATFDPKVDYKSRERVISMSIKDFLAMALPFEGGASKSKLKKTTELLQEGAKYATLPYLTFEARGQAAYVDGHEGRHRAVALQAAGFTTMPVVLKGNIRWSEQHDPNRFDYRETWPTVLVSQDGAKRIPFPVTREEAGEPFKD